MDANRCAVNKEKLDRIHDYGNYGHKQLGMDRKKGNWTGHRQAYTGQELDYMNTIMYIYGQEQVI